MPPTVRFTRDAVLHAACQLMRREGMEALNARAIAKELGGSTQPIFRLFTNMEDLHRELILYVARQFQAHAEAEMAQSASPYIIGTFVDGSMSQLNYVPADWTDFIFATIGEAFGFAGCSIIMLWYLAIILRMLYLARYTYDRQGMLIIIGVIGMLLFHVFENIGMTLGRLPITGIPLPFLSYGGSNMVTNIGGIALVLNVTKNRQLTQIDSSRRFYSSYAKYTK